MWTRVRQGQREEIEMDKELEDKVEAQAEAEMEVKDKVEDNAQGIMEDFKIIDLPEPVHIRAIHETLDILNGLHGIKDGETAIPADLGTKVDSEIELKDNKSRVETFVATQTTNACSSKFNNVELPPISKKSKTNSILPKAIVKK